MKPKYNTSKFRNQTIGASLVTAITVCLSGSAFAVDNFWTGTTSTDWSTATNWSLGRVPANPNGATTGDNFDDAVVNVKAPNIATITTTVTTPRDFRIGQGAATDGRLDLVSGSASTGGGNWAFVGRDGGIGVFNLANTAGTGGTLTGFAQGSGSFTCNGSRLYVGGANADGGAGTGTFNMNTSGTLTIGNDLAVGSSIGTGVMNVDSGSITTGGWNFIGKNENGSGANGKLFMAGGTLTNTGRTYVGQAGSTGLLELTGGSYRNVNNELFIMGEDNVGNGTLNVKSSASTLQCGGEMWLGQNAGSTGLLDIQAGTVTVNNWLAVGRGGTGTVRLSGGSLTKTGGGSVSIANFANAVGIVEVSGGLFDVQSGNLIVGEGGGGSASLLFTGGEIKAPQVLVATGGTVVSTVSFNGGILRTGVINGAGGGTSNVSFNGTEIIPTAIQPSFITGIDAPTIGTGGMVVNTSFAVGSTQAFTGGGGVVKSGTGTLTLSGASAYSGANTVSAGKLAVTTANTNSGDYTVNNLATLGIRQTSNTSSLTVPNANFGSGGATTLDLDLGSFTANPTAAPLNVTGALTVNGTLTVNIADGLPAVGNIPLISYVGPTSVAANITLGTLPNGVVATLDKTTTPGLVYLNVTSASLPVWRGNVDGGWTTALNWFDQVSGAVTTYADPSPVLFNDTLTGTPLVVLNSTVLPSKVTFNNSLTGYFLSGTGKISGTGSLLKQGTSSLSISTLNDYTGTTTLEGGVTSVTSLANGGSPSSIGASSASPSNLILSGATLNYSGATATTDRGFTLNAANSTVSTVNSLTTSGQVAATVGSLIKAGGGNLTLSNPGTNLLATTGQVMRVNGGTLTLDGSGTQVNTVLGELWTGTVPDVPADLVLNNTTLNVSSWIAMGRGNGTTSTLTRITATGSTMTCTNFSTGFDGGIALNDSDHLVTLTNSTWTNGGSTTLSESLNASTVMSLLGASTYTTPGITQLAPGTGTSAELTIGGTSVFNTSRFVMALGNGSNGKVTVQDSGSLVKTGGWLSIGNSGTGVGLMTVKNSGTVTADGDFNVADVDTSTGTLTVQDNAVVTSTGGALFVAKNSNTTGTVNLNGGRIIANRVFGNAGAGNSTFNFNGGVLQPGAGMNADFMSGIDEVVIKALGATIDTGATAAVNINQTIKDDTTNGQFTKLGTGTLNMNGSNSYTGTTVVSAGTLGGTGRINGLVSVQAGANVNPGAPSGTLSVDSLSFAGAATLTIDISDQAESLAVSQNLNLANATLVLNGTPTLPTYVLASYGTLSGTFPAVTLPPGYVIDYNYSDTNQIVITRPETPFETWMAGYFPNQTNPAIVGPGADPDGDGSSNALEFALGGIPNDPVDGPKVYHLEADSSGDANTNKELLLTIAVRSGTPVFAGSPSPTALKDGFTYTIQGSVDLAAFNTGVTVVTPVTTNLPDVPTGYVYRTFSLSGSDGLGGKGFLRVRVN
ncbi:MAG: autotransporter-associated beta strand repeat-containing protein [Verrucomicrobiota bacterium]